MVRKWHARGGGLVSNEVLDSSHGANSVAGKHLYGVELDIDLSSNPTVRDMFNDPTAFRELLGFFKEYGLGVVSAFTGGSHTTTHIKVEGPGAGIQKFVAEYLSDDPPADVYTLLYRER
jgi:hypothetical protein